MSQRNANSWKFILLVDLTFLRVQNMHLKLLYGELRLVLSNQGVLLNIREVSQIVLNYKILSFLGFVRPRWNLSLGRFCGQAWLGWSWHRWMSSCCNASLLWADFIGRSYKRSSGIRSQFTKPRNICLCIWFLTDWKKKRKEEEWAITKVLFQMQG